MSGQWKAPGRIVESPGSLSAFGIKSIEGARITTTDPSVSQAQQHYMGAVYGRRKAGHPLPGDPKMAMEDLRSFAATPTKGLPKRVRER